MKWPRIINRSPRSRILILRKGIGKILKFTGAVNPFEHTGVLEPSTPQTVITWQVFLNDQLRLSPYKVEDFFSSRSH